MRILTNRATRDDVARFWEEVDPLTETYQAKDIEAVLNISFRANANIFTIYKEEEHKNMSQALCDYLMDTELMKDRVEVIREEAKRDGKRDGVFETVKAMLKDGVSVQNAAKWSRLPIGQVQQLAANL